MGAELHNTLLFLISIARRKNLIQELGMEKSTVSKSKSCKFYDLGTKVKQL